jgi:hypothetical protein
VFRQFSFRTGSPGATRRIVFVARKKEATMFRLRDWIMIAALLALPARAGADVALDWNEQGMAAVLAAKQLAPDGARSMAMMHVAMFNAVNAVERRYASYGFEIRAPRGASANAAAISAARTVLVKLFPEQREAIERAHAVSLDKISGERGIEAGTALGEQAANHCLAMRANDGVGAENRYRPVTAPGVYVPTAMPVSYEWREVKPWVMRSPSQFRPDPPPALGGATWARDYDEIKEIGSKNSAKRTAEQTDVARFWTAIGAATWNPIVRSLAGGGARTLVENARLFALVNMAASDAYVAVFDGKYAFNFWRPVTAIRNGDIDGNEATHADAGWLPLIETPLHPEYPCAHCITASAVGAVLESVFGSGKVSPITMTSPTAPGVIRRWERIADYVKEVDDARIWGGIHYRNSTEVGARMGREIGRLVVASVMRASAP